LRISERPPAALVSFVARQIDVRPETIDDYLSSEQNRRRHAAEVQNRLRLRPFGRRPAAELASWLLPHAIENDRLAYLAELVMEECRQRRVAAPPPRSLERLCVELRYQARREIERRLTGALSAERWPGLLDWRSGRGERRPKWHGGVGRFRDRRHERQSHRAAALNLATACIGLFNCRYLDRAVTDQRR